MAKYRDFRGRYAKAPSRKKKVVKQKTKHPPLKWWEAFLIIFSCLGIVSGLFTIFHIFLPGLIQILFWGAIFYFLINRYNKRKEQLDTLKKNQKSDLSEAEKEEKSRRDNEIIEGRYRKQAESLRGKIEAGEVINLTVYEESKLQPYFKELYPDVTIKINKYSKIYSTIAGFQYNDGYKPEVKKMLEENPSGQPLKLERDPDNPNSTNKSATKIFWKEYFLGYVPSFDSPRVSAALDNGSKVSARIERYDPLKQAYERVSIVIYIKENE